MSTQRPVEMPDLLASVMGDPGSLIDGIVRHVLEQLAQEGELVGSGGESPRELLATAVGTRLARLIGGSEAIPERGPRPDELAHYAELLDRSCTLAAALGACDCWGLYADCPFCGGAGTPGWTRPDAQLFALHVHPAVRALSGQSVPAASTRKARKETAHGQYMGG